MHASRAVAALISLSAALSGASCREQRVEPAADAARADAAPTQTRRMMRRERRCMGTLCAVTAFHADDAVVDRAANEAFDEMDRLELLMTNWRPTSDVEKVNAAAGKSAVEVAPETLEVIDKAIWVAAKTGGAFDVTVGAFFGLWKFDEDNDGSIPTTKQVRARLPLVDYKDILVDRERRTVKLRRAGQKINLGGIAKGYIVDAGVARLRKAGLRDFLVQAGGDLFASGRKGDRDWIVGIQDPRAPRELPKSGATTFATLSLSNQAFNTSGDYERFVIRGGRRYHHVLDPRTGFPVTHTRAVTLLAPSAFLADAIDTAILVMGAEAGMKLVEELPEVAAVIVDGKNRVHVSSRLKDRLKLMRQPTDGI